jgi:two-component system, OmpR family, sensor kinase
MSSSRPNSRFNTRSLSVRLVALSALLVTVVSVVLSIVTTLAIRGYLVDRLDNQLDLARVRAENPFYGNDDGPPPTGNPPDDNGRHRPPPGGQGAGTLEAEFAAGAATGSRVSDRGRPVSLSETALATLGKVPTDAAERSVEVPGLGHYRVIAVDRPNGSVLVTGLPLDDVEAVVHRLVLLDLGVGLAAIGLVGGVGVVLVRRQLQPLEAVASTAQRVAQLPLDRGDVDLSERVDERYTDPRSEAGQVGSALNHMLNHVSGALATRHESETRVRQMLADASHELRTPLATIRGYAELSSRPSQQSPDELKSYARQIESQSDRMAQIVDDLLMLARLDSGRPLEQVPVDVSRLIAESVAAAQVRAPGHRWQVQLPPQPLVIIGDESRLHQLLTNLLSNASRHTPAGTTVTTSAHRDDESVRILVHDDGPGIDPALQPTVFERFARGDSSRTRASGGAGLGLSLVRAIAQAHRGTVSVDSRPHDTTFTVVLPGTSQHAHRIATQPTQPSR